MALSDCTDNVARSRLNRALITLVTVALATACLAGGARADGDPASDVLLGQSLFLPQDAGATASQQSELAALLAAAQRSGYRIHVAVIASPADLGSITELWRQPQTYARFLGEELSIVYRGALLVIMPNGYGVDGVGGARIDPSALHGLAQPGNALGAAAIGALRRLAAAAGHPLAAPAPTAGSVAGAPGSPDAVPWVVFVAGLLLIGAAWMASLRARPLGAAKSAPGGGSPEPQ